jgi:hypothetical protein
MMQYSAWMVMIAGWLFVVGLIMFGASFGTVLGFLNGWCGSPYAVGVNNVAGVEARASV